MIDRDALGAYPLTWPEGVPRTPPGQRVTSRFATGFGKARDGLMDELKRLGVEFYSWSPKVVVSTNVPTRRDGLPYAGMATPEDTGAAIYFVLEKRQLVLACDRYRSVGDNLHALAKTIEAMRTIQRHGGTRMLERAFQGFTALPPPPAAEPKRPWWEVMQLPRNAALENIRAQRRVLARIFHEGGTAPDPRKMAEINAAADEAEREWG